MSSLTHVNLWNSKTGNYLEKRKSNTDSITPSLGRKPKMAKYLLYIPTVSRKNRLPVYLQIKPTIAPEKILILSGRQWLQEKEKRKREGKKGESKVKKKIRFFLKRKL